MPAPRSFQVVVLATSLLTLAAQSLHGHGSYHDMVDEIHAKLKVAPDDAALHYRLAEAHAGHEEWKACLEEISQVERLAPDRFPTGYLRGLALFIGERNEEAKDALDHFLIANPKHVEALATRGRVFAKLNRAAEAIADLQAAMKLSPSPSSELVMDLALSYQKSGKPEEASRIFDEALKTTTDAPSLLDCALKIETAAGLWDSALSRIDGLEKNAPSPEPWMAKRAELLAKAGRVDDARAKWTALRDHLISLPSLQRGSPQNTQLLSQARQALGETAPAPVAVPPAS